MMRFMQMFVDERVMQTAVDQIDEKIGKDEEERELQIVVVGPGCVGEGVVEFGVALDFGPEEGRGHDCDPGHGVPGLFYFHADLVFEEFGVLEGRFVEDESVG